MGNPERLYSIQKEGLQEKCGVTAILSKKNQDVSSLIPRYQYALHNRGRDSSGIATFDWDTGTISLYKGEGSTGTVFQMHTPESKIGPPSMEFDFIGNNLNSDVGIGHNRYGTSGDEHKDSTDGAQPMFAQWEGRSVAIAFNGNLPLSERRKLQEKIPEGMTKGLFDTNDIVNAIVSAPGEDWQERIKNAMDGVKGAYSLTILADDGNIYGLRGPSGTWPLWLGESDDQVVLSSESIVDRSLAWTEVNAGELVQLTRDGVIREQIYTPQEARCFVHAVYLANPDSLMTENKKYREFRRELGARLALEYPVVADYYTYVPNTAKDVAFGYTEALGVELTEVFRIVKNADRSYISKDNKSAEDVVDNKFELIEGMAEKLRGKRIVKIDETNIKGLTERKTNGILRGVGVGGIIDLFGAPELIDACDQGVVVRKESLVALEILPDGSSRVRDYEEIARITNADIVYYLSQEGVDDVSVTKFCMGCMGREHPLHGNNTTSPITLYKSNGRAVDKVPELDRISTAAD